MDNNIRKLVALIMVLFLALVLNLTYQQVVTSKAVADNNANPRKLQREYGIQRGNILAADGQTVLARSVPIEGPIKYQREYPGAEAYAAAVGYDSPQFGRAGLESQYNDALLGTGQSQDLLRDLFNTSTRGYDLLTTLNPIVQDAAVTALGPRRGAVVAMNPDTGAILAMASWPSFDSNAIASQAKDASGKLLAEVAKAAYDKDPNSPLLNRSTMGLYPPGSSFKVLNAAAGLDSGMVNPADILDCTGAYTIGGHTFGDRTHGPVDMLAALTVSCNNYFSHSALTETARVLVDYAQRFGLNSAPPIDYPAVAMSTIPQAARMDQVELAATGFGQGELLLTPLQLAMIGSAIANDGREMTPHLMKEVRDAQGNILEKYDPKLLRQVVSASTASQVLNMMISVVENGTGQAAQIPGYIVAGKTGTAEPGNGKPNHAWFLGIAPADNPQVVVAVVIENSGGTGGEDAAPVAQQVMKAVLGVR